MPSNGTWPKRNQKSGEWMKHKCSERVTGILCVFVFAIRIHDIIVLADANCGKNHNGKQEIPNILLMNDFNENHSMWAWHKIRVSSNSNGWLVRRTDIVLLFSYSSYKHKHITCRTPTETIQTRKVWAKKKKIRKEKKSGIENKNRTNNWNSHSSGANCEDTICVRVCLHQLAIAYYRSI